MEIFFFEAVLKPYVSMDVVYKIVLPPFVRLQLALSSTLTVSVVFTVCIGDFVLFCKWAHIETSREDSISANRNIVCTATLPLLLRLYIS